MCSSSYVKVMILTQILSQREDICFTGLGLEFSQPHPQSSQLLFQLLLQVALIHPDNLL